MKRLRSFFSRRKLRNQDRNTPSQQPTSSSSTSQPQQQQQQQPVESSVSPKQQQTAGQEPAAQAVLAHHHQSTQQQPLNLSIQATPGTLNIALRNDTTSSTVYAYITGQALDRGNALFLLQADGRTPYFPANPPKVGSPLGANCAMVLGAPGHTFTAMIPHIAGGRIWFSIGSPLTFALNPGPALVEPSVSNPSDPNAHIDWAFAEFTYNNDQLYANISYVDFVSIPISLSLDTVSGARQHVSGMGTTGLQTIADGLRAQASADGHPWDQLIVNRQGTSSPLRILSPNLGMVGNPNFLANYFDNFVNQTFIKYDTQMLSVDTQAAAGIVNSSTGASNPNLLVVGSQTFTKPSTRDIFTCSTGPFATGSNAERNALIPRIAAAFNRSTLLATNSLPAPQSLYYKNATTNHYSRIVHTVNLDGKGYAFPYDDVQPLGGKDQSGEVHAGDPKLFTVAIGGGRASIN